MFSQVKQAMLKSAKQRILAVDHTKFNNVAFSHNCELTSIDMVVTDKSRLQSGWPILQRKELRAFMGKKTRILAICQ